jgi:hypothetical protein
MSMITEKLVRVVVGSATICCTALVGQMVGLALADPGCQKPNPNTTLCTEIPSGAVTSCTGQALCSGAIYEINSFPNGAVPAGSGTTSESQANCIRGQSCFLDTSVSPAQCAANILPSPWSPGARTIAGGASCPEE